MRDAFIDKNFLDRYAKSKIMLVFDHFCGVDGALRDTQFKRNAGKSFFAKSYDHASHFTKKTTIEFTSKQKKKEETNLLGRFPVVEPLRSKSFCPSYSTKRWRSKTNRFF